MSPQAIQLALYDALGPGGLNWLQNITGGGLVTQADVQMTTTPAADNVHYYLKLHSDFSKAIGVNLGLDGLGLTVDGSATMQSGFDVALGFGVSKQNGFYLDANDSVDVTFDTQLPAATTGHLGYFSINVASVDVRSAAGLPTNVPLPQLNGRIQATIGDPHGTGGFR